MMRKPVTKTNSVFSDGLGIQMMLEGMVIGGLALTAYMLGYRWYTLEEARTMAFTVLSLSQLFHVYNVRSKESLFRIGFFTNHRLNIAFIICFIMQIGVIMIPITAKIFSVIPLDLRQWAVVFGLSATPILAVELQKWINRKER